jgi:hypothetical protein
MLLKPSSQAVRKALELRRSQATKSLDLPSLLFPEQLAFVTDPSPFKTGVCSRRAGKSSACAVDLVNTAMANREVTALYVTGTRTDAKKIIWPEVKRLNRTLGLKGEVNESELTVTLGSSIIRLSGAKDSQEIDKIRGQLPPIKKAYIDEAQKFKPSLLKQLVDDVLEPALLDYNGSLSLIGTPGPVPAGYFFDASQSSQWSHHAWTFFDNPFLPIKSKKTHQELLERVLKRRGMLQDDPAIRREYFGEWIQDEDSLLLHYRASLNHYTEAPKRKPVCVMGVDLGFHDADAIAILGWFEDSQDVYLLEESVVRKQDITSLAQAIETLRLKWDVSKIVMDTGGIGKKVAEEISRRKHIPVHAADKARKMENVALLNDWLRTGRMKAKSDSQFAHDCGLIEIDRDKSTPDRIVVSSHYHSDIADAVLYAFRESPAYSYQKPAARPRVGSPEWAAEENERMFNLALEDALERERLDQEAREAYGGDY